MDRDLVIVIAADGLSSPHAVVERGPNGGAVLLSFLPQLGSKAGAAELIFVVDRSGSMGGTSIEEVRNALQLCLRSLTPGSHFNIVSFGSTCAPLFGASRPYDEASLAEAAAFVAAMDADMGGTEILPALQFAVQQPALAGLPRQVLVLTDGEVTNTDEVVDLARRHAASARCFTFGIGAGASHHLVKGLARASRGAAEFISPGERIEAKVMRQFKRVFAPAITDVTVDWGQTGVTTASDRVPPVFDGERLRVYALAESIGTGSATLRGLVAGQPVAFDVPIDPAEAAEGDTIATLAARERIRALEEQGDYLESRGSRQRRARAAHAAAVEIAALGVKYQLASRETSFVAVEHRDAPVEGRAELRRVPVALTSGWGGLRETGVHYLYAPQMAFASLPAVLPTPGGPGSARGLVWSFPGQDMPQPGDERLEADDAIACSLEAPGHGPRPWRASPPRSYDQRVTAPRERARRPLDVLVSLQRADGSWDLAAEFATAVSVTLRRLEKELRNATGDPGTIRRALATAMALAWLEKHAASQRMEWELLADKAQAWLEASHTEPAPGAGWHAWLDLAQRLA